MVQFLSIIFFLFLQFLLGFSKVPVFLCHPVCQPSGAYNFEMQACHAVRFKTKMEHVDKFQYNYQTSSFKKTYSPVRQLLAHRPQLNLLALLYAPVWSRKSAITFVKSVCPSASARFPLDGFLSYMITEDF